MTLLKKIIRVTLLMLLIGGILSLFAFMQEQENQLLCSKVRIAIIRNPSQEIFFVEEDAVRELIAKKFGQIENTALSNIDVNKLERLMYTNPWVEQADVYMSINGVMNIEIQQKQPILRIINSSGESFYMDTQGNLMPWSPDFTPRTIVANGSIDERYSIWSRISMDEIINSDTLKTLTILDDLCNLTRFILADEFWQAYTEQIFLNEQKDIELVPKAGNHKIIFGSADEIAAKFQKLKIFYKEGLSHTGWKQYDTLNLKFNNQMVCTKR